MGTSNSQRPLRVPRYLERPGISELPIPRIEGRLAIFLSLMLQDRRPFTRFDKALKKDCIQQINASILHCEHAIWYLVITHFRAEYYIETSAKSSTQKNTRKEMKMKITPSSTMTAIEGTRGKPPLLSPCSDVSTSYLLPPGLQFLSLFFFSYFLSVVRFFSILFFHHLQIIADTLLTPFIFCHCRSPAKRIHVGK